MAVAVEMAVTVEDVVALVVMVDLVAVVEVTLVDKVEEEMTGQLLLLALMYIREGKSPDDKKKLCIFY
jgi:hypothetical protein